MVTGITSRGTCHYGDATALAGRDVQGDAQTGEEAERDGNEIRFILQRPHWSEHHHNILLSFVVEYARERIQII